MEILNDLAYLKKYVEEIYKKNDISLNKKIRLEEINEKESLTKALTDRAGFPVKIMLGNKGKRKEMIELILRNIELIQNKNADPGLVELREILKLPTIPRIIECFDISNHGD